MYPILVWYIKKWRLTEEVGRWMADSDNCEHNILVPGSNPHPDTIVFANFHVTAILAIST
jgi:hypothetical protein